MAVQHTKLEASIPRESTQIKTREARKSAQSRSEANENMSLDSLLQQMCLTEETTMTTDLNLEKMKSKEEDGSKAEGVEAWQQKREEKKDRGRRTDFSKRVSVSDTDSEDWPSFLSPADTDYNRTFTPSHLDSFFFHSSTPSSSFFPKLPLIRLPGLSLFSLAFTFTLLSVAHRSCE